MGTFLKVVGVIALIWFGLAAVGCAIIMSALSHGRSGSAYSAAVHDMRGRNDVIEAIRDDRIDLAQLPNDIATTTPLTVTLTDGTTRTLGNSSSDRLVRTLLAARADARNSSSGYGSSTANYPYREAENQPHFKPGEPMLDPTPGGGR